MVLASLTAREGAGAQITHYLEYARLRDGAVVSGVQPAPNSEVAYAMAYPHCKLAEQLLAEGNLEEAVVELEVAISLHASTAPFYRLLGEAWLRLAAYDAGIAACRQAVRLASEDPWNHFLLGKCLNGAGEREAAIEAYQSAVRLAPTWMEAQECLGVALYVVGRRSEALPLFRSLAETYPLYALPHHMWGRCLDWNTDCLEAIGHLREAVRMSPHNAGMHRWLGKALVWKGDIEEGIARLQEAGMLKPENADIQVDLAAALLKAGNFEAALSAACRAVILQPNRADAHFNLALSIEVMQQFEFGRVVYERLLRQMPHNPHLIYHLVTHYYQAGRLDDLMASYGQLVENGQGDATARYGLGVALMLKELPHAALPHLRTAVDLCPAEAQMRITLGWCYTAVRRDEEAYEHFEVATRLYPDAADAWEEMAVIHQKRREWERAIQCFHKCLCCDFSRQEVRLELARTYIQVQDYGQARELLEHIVPHADHDLLERTQKLLADISEYTSP